MNTYKKLLKYVPEKKGYAFLAVILSILATVLLIAPYWYFWKFLIELLVYKNVAHSKTYAFTIIILMVANVIVYYLAVWSSHLLAFRLETNLRKAGIRHLMNASFAFFDRNSSGRIRKIIDDNAAQTHTIVAHLIPDLTGAILTPILLIITTFFVDVKLGLLMLIVTMIGGIQVKGMSGDSKFMAQYMNSLEKMSAESVEYVRGMQVIKIFRTTITSFKTFYNAILDYSKQAYGYTLTCRRPYVSFQVIFNIFITFAIVIAIYFMNPDDTFMIIAKVVFFACFAGMMFTMLMKIMYVSMYQYLATTAVDKLEGLFMEMEKDNIHHGDIEVFQSFAIEFKNATFSYKDDAANVIEDLSFILKEGKTYAIVGSSGGGKSTIAKLISGFYNLKAGSINIGGKDIKEYSQKGLMKHIAFVFQNAKLFKTTIYENVKMGNEEASDEQVMEALRQAKCDDILDKFSTREQTVIGAKGVYLSGGEVQRVAIARAILKDADIVILDEASAAADPENEFEIQQAFTNLMKNKTVIMIAHRLSSIRNVDEILVVENGCIIERGNDKELMKLNGRYKQLQDSYSEANDWRVK